MNDIIKQAVELAEGWEWVNEHRVTIDGVGHWFSSKDAPDYLKDALAAQLVRQVKAKRFCYIERYVSDEHDDYVVVGGSKTLRKVVKGGDDTENTIRAIVESGVLDG